MADYISKINENIIGGSQFDGNWVSSNTWLAAAFTMTANQVKTFDISSVVPADGYDYEIQFSLYTNSSGTSASNAFYIAQGTTATTSSLLVGYVNATSAGAHNSCINFNLPILASGARTVALLNGASKATGNMCLGICAKRRMGNTDKLSNRVENVAIPNKTLPIKGDFTDGSWKNVYTSVTSNISIASGKTVSVSLSSIIPKDNYFYEVAVMMWGSVPSGSWAELVLSDAVSTMKYICRYNPKGSSSGGLGGNCIIVVKGTSPTVNIVNNGNGTYTMSGFRLCGYKRLANVPTGNYIRKLNSLTIGGDSFNGSWVNKLVSVISGATLNNTTSGTTYSYTVSNYLPDNVNNYEIICTGSGITGTALGNYSSICLVGDSVTIGGQLLLFISNRGTAGSGTTNSQFFKTVAKQNANGNLVFKIAAYTTTAMSNVRLRLYAYRRIGTAGTNL